MVEMPCESLNQLIELILGWSEQITVS